MKRQDWTYLAQLVWVLQQESIDGHRIGEMVAEVEQHLVESGADPVDEFGSPAALAVELARQPGTRRPAWIPPQWLAHLGALGLLVILMPIFAPDSWEASSIAITSQTLAWAVAFSVAVFWIQHLANKRLDGRSWKALGWSIVPAAVAGVVFRAGDGSTLLSLPKTPYLAFCAVVGSALLIVLIRANNPVRFPKHAQHLNALKRGVFAGRPPVSRQV